VSGTDAIPVGGAVALEGGGLAVGHGASGLEFDTVVADGAEDVGDVGGDLHGEDAADVVGSEWEAD